MSNDGFQEASKMMTLLAATRLMPREPARVEMRNKRPLKEHEEESGWISYSHIPSTAQLTTWWWKMCVIPCVTGIIELFGPLLSGGGVGGAIQAVVVDVPEPLAFTCTQSVRRPPSLSDVTQLHKTRDRAVSCQRNFFGVLTNSWWGWLESSGI